MSEQDDCRYIFEWSKEFRKLYAKHDVHRRPEEIWISTMAYCSTIGEDIRRIDYRELIESAAHAFNWMCTFVTACNTTEDPLFRCENDFCDIVYFKFPGVCGHCTESKCNCDSYEMDKKKDKASKYLDLYEKWKLFPKKKYKINDWIETFKKIYKGRIHLMTLDSIGFHFLEEAGEEIRAIRQLIQMRGVLHERINGVDDNFFKKLYDIGELVSQYKECMNVLEKDKENKPKIDMVSRDSKHIKARIVKGKMDLVVEFADTFSWFCAILIKLEMISEGLCLDFNIHDLEQCLIAVYGPKGNQIKCSTCKEINCKCIFFPLKRKEVCSVKNFQG